MPKFSQQSFSILSTCHIDLQTIFFEVIRSFDCIVLSGYRAEVEEEKEFSSCDTQFKWPHGKHNQQPSMAVDVSLYPVDGDSSAQFHWFAGYVMGIAQKLRDEGKVTHAIRYGGDYHSKSTRPKTFQDLVHFELVE